MATLKDKNEVDFTSDVSRKYTRKELLGMIKKLPRLEFNRWLKSDRTSPEVRELFREVDRERQERRRQHAVRSTGATLYPTLSDGQFEARAALARSLSDEEKCRLMGPGLFRHWTEQGDREDASKKLREELQDGILPADKKYFAEYAYLRKTREWIRHANETLYTRIFSTTFPKEIERYKAMFRDGRYRDLAKDVLSGDIDYYDVDRNHTYKKHELPDCDGGRWVTAGDGNGTKIGFFTNPVTGEESLDVYTQVTGQDVRDYLTDGIGYEYLASDRRPEIESPAVRELHEDILSECEDYAIARSASLADDLPEGFTWHRGDPNDVKIPLPVLIKGSTEDAAINEISVKGGRLNVEGIDGKGHAVRLDLSSLPPEWWNTLEKSLKTTQEKRENSVKEAPAAAKQDVWEPISPGGEEKIFQEAHDRAVKLAAEAPEYLTRRDDDIFKQVEEVLGGVRAKNSREHAVKRLPRLYGVGDYGPHVPHKDVLNFSIETDSYGAKGAKEELEQYKKAIEDIAKKNGFGKVQYYAYSGSQCAGIVMVRFRDFNLQESRPQEESLSGGRTATVSPDSTGRWHQEAQNEQREAVAEGHDPASVLPAHDGEETETAEEKAETDTAMKQARNEEHTERRSGGLHL